MEPTEFEGRALKPHAEPLSAGKLKQGSVYFFLNYADDAMLLPTLQPVVFLGTDLRSGDVGVIYFQDVDSYQRGVRYDSPAEDGSGEFYSGPEGETGHVFDYERALEELMRCSLRRRRVGKG